MTTIVYISLTITAYYIAKLVVRDVYLTVSKYLKPDWARAYYSKQIHEITQMHNDGYITLSNVTREKAIQKLSKSIK